MSAMLTKCNVCGCSAPFTHGRCESCDMTTNRKLARLAAYERNTIQRRDTMPHWASMWVKGADGTCEYWGVGGYTGAAPDFRPDAAGPMMQPIVDVE